MPATASATISVAYLGLIPVATLALAVFRAHFVRKDLVPTDSKPLAADVMKRVQHRIIAEGCVPVSAFTVGGAWAAQRYIDMAPFQLSSAQSCLSFTFKAHTPCLVVLFVLFARVFDHRYKCPQAINHKDCPHLDFDYTKRHLQNTVEQFVFALTSQLALSQFLAPAQMAVIPYFVAVWVAGRIFFVLEYDGLGPNSGTRGRILGFLMTFIPSAYATLCCVFAFASFIRDPAKQPWSPLSIALW